MKKFYITSLEPGKEKKYVRLWRIRYPIGEYYDNGQPKCTAERFHGTWTQAVAYATDKTSTPQVSSTSHTVFSYCTGRNELEHKTGAVSDNTFKKRRDFLDRKSVV